MSKMKADDLTSNDIQNKLNENLQRQKDIVHAIVYDAKAETEKADLFELLHNIHCESVELETELHNMIIGGDKG